MTIKSYINKGNSCPVILENGGKTYFVKLHAGMSGKYALVSEWIGSQLGNQLGIPSQIPNWIDFKSDLEIDNIHVEVKDLILKSLGTNIGFSYLKQAKEVDKVSLENLEEQRIQEIFLFDLMMINVDRSLDNINLMKVDDKIFSVDYESSLLVQELIEGKKYLENERILKCFRQNPLYREMSEESIDNFLRKVENLSIEKAISEVPVSLLSVEKRNLIRQGIEVRKKDKWFLKEIMKNLQSIQMETKEEGKRRRNRNQAEFKRKFKENLR